MPDTLQSVFDLPEVSFIDNDTVDAMMNRMVSNFEKKYKEVTGKSRSLAPADPMRILIYSVALDLYQLEMYTDRAGKQDLLKYSYGEFLDNLGGNRGDFFQQSLLSASPFQSRETTPSASQLEPASPTATAYTSPPRNMARSRPGKRT